MINLQKIKRKYYNIIDTEGRKLNINLPSQAFLSQLVEMYELDMDEGEALEAAYKILLSIFNQNVEGYIYDEDYVAQFDAGTVKLILNDYTQFITEQLSL